MEKERINEQDLIAKVQGQKCQISLRALNDKYKNLIYSTAISFKYKYTKVPLEIDDFLNFAHYFFYEVVLEYKLEHKKFFASYAKEFLYYKMSNEIRKFVTKNNIVMNFATSLYEDSVSSQEEDDSNESIDWSDYDYLSTSELSVAKLLSKGEKPSEISRTLNKTISSVYSTVQRTKKKIRNQIREY